MSTFAHQNSLPSLPVPNLKAACERYLKSCQPFLSQAEFEKTKATVDDFVKPGGVGERLDQQLRAKAGETNPSNWLEDWWLKYAYLAYPDPITFNSNYALHIDNDQGVKWNQTQMAALFVAKCRDFYLSIRDETLKPEQVGGRMGPYLDMFQYTKMFGSTRNPGEKCDVPFEGKTGNHIVVICRRQYFKLEIEGVHVSDLDAAFQEVKKLAAANEGDMCKHGGLGLLTAGNRPAWAKARAELLKDPDSAATLRAIEEAILVCVLDESAPEGTDVLRACHGGDANQRYFDKVISVIVFANGKAGLNCEHSPADAMCCVQLMHYVEPFLAKKDAFAGAPSAGTSVKPARLPVNLSPPVQDALGKAAAGWEDHQKNFATNILFYEKYGKEAIKSWRMSPDSFMQMALQLAYTRVAGAPGATYETAMSRLYFHGRTETCRSCSAESVAFVDAMNSPTASTEEKKALLQKAIKAHQAFIKAASTGQGCDRYLMGLKILQLEQGEDLHPIFTDPVYKQSSSFMLSTSNVSPTAHSFGGFGPVATNGYGVCYAYHTGGNLIKVSVAGNPRDPLSDIDRLEAAISQALDDMGALYGGKPHAKPLVTPSVAVAVAAVVAGVTVWWLRR